MLGFVQRTLLVLVGVAAVSPALAQGTDKIEKVAPAPRAAPAKPAPAPDAPPVSAATDPRLKAALAGVSTPLPEGLSLRAPGAGVPAQLRAFYGVWTGKFENGVPIVAVIDSINGASAMVIHSWATTGKLKGGFARVRGRFQGGTLEAKDDQRKLEYRILGGDSLEVTIDNSRGTGRGVLKRVY
jgi:hypothetical protein